LSRKKRIVQLKQITPKGYGEKPREKGGTGGLNEVNALQFFNMGNSQQKKMKSRLVQPKGGKKQKKGKGRPGTMDFCQSHTPGLLSRDVN